MNVDLFHTCLFESGEGRGDIMKQYLVQTRITTHYIVLLRFLKWQIECCYTCSFFSDFYSNAGHSLMIVSSPTKTKKPVFPRGPLLDILQISIFSECEYVCS